MALSVLATAVVALAFDPVQTRLERATPRLVNDGQPSPYDVLRTFSQTVTGSYDMQELPSRMARVLADGTARSGPRSGWSSAAARSWPPPGPPAPKRRSRGPGRIPEFRSR